MYWNICRSTPFDQHLVEAFKWVSDIHEKDKPFEGFARSSSEEMLLPPPVPQEWLDYLEEIDPPPPLRDDAWHDAVERKGCGE